MNKVSHNYIHPTPDLTTNISGSYLFSMVKGRAKDILCIIFLKNLFKFQERLQPVLWGIDFVLPTSAEALGNFFYFLFCQLGALVYKEAKGLLYWQQQRLLTGS